MGTTCTDDGPSTIRVGTASARGHGEATVGAAGEGEAGDHGVLGARVARRGVLGEVVAEPEGDPLAADPLEGLHHVGVVAEHQVDVGGGEQGAGDRALRRRLVGHVLHAAVHAGHHDVDAAHSAPAGTATPLVRATPSVPASREWLDAEAGVVARAGRRVDGLGLHGEPRVAAERPGGRRQGVSRWQTARSAARMIGATGARTSVKS